MKSQSKKMKKGLAAAVAVTAIGGAVVGGDILYTNHTNDIKNEKKAQKAYENLYGVDKIFMSYNKVGAAQMAMPDWGEVASASLEMVYFTEKGNYLRFIDEESNGFGNVDKIRVSDFGPVEVKNPSKKLKKFANEFYHASLDHNMAYYEEGKHSFEGPEMDEFYKMVLKELPEKDKNF